MQSLQNAHWFRQSSEPTARTRASAMQKAEDVTTAAEISWDQYFGRICCGAPNRMSNSRHSRCESEPARSLEARHSLTHSVSRKPANSHPKPKQIAPRRRSAYEGYMEPGRGPILVETTHTLHGPQQGGQIHSKTDLDLTHASGCPPWRPAVAWLCIRDTAGRCATSRSTPASGWPTPRTTKRRAPGGRAGAHGWEAGCGGRTDE